MHPILRFILQRAIVSIATIFMIATVTFILMKSAPGDPFQDEKGIPAECLLNMKHFYGLDDPLPQQYFRYVRSVFSFDFGPSLKYPTQSVNEIIRSGFMTSCILGLEALVLAAPVGILFGVLSALKANRIEDTATRTFSVIGVSLPSFVIASGLQFLLGIYFPLFPIARMSSFYHTILPALSLAIGPACMISRLLRSSILEIINRDFIHTAHAKGLEKNHILTFHILKNAILPILSYLGPLTANILVGSFIVERVFAIPGLGQWFVNGVMTRDYPVIGGLTLFYSIILLGVHTVIDIISAQLDPRIDLYSKKQTV
jgi:oligopeptide transport system permease protein